jgi:hypothetical protein
MSSDYHEQEALEKELLDYIRILNKSKEKQTKELTKEPKISKPIALSNLRSPGNKNVELSKDDVKTMLDRISNLIIRYGKEVMP